MAREPEFIAPDWAAPPRVHAAFTLRTGGVSAPPFDSFNCATHVGDAVAAVKHNRAQLRARLALPGEPAWLEQVHGIRAVRLEERTAPHGGPAAAADVAVTGAAGRVCVVQVADCLPVLFAACDGSAVGAAHAGWRGLAGGVLESAVRALGVAPAGLLAWLGPAIGPAHFEVGEEVRAAFTRADPAAEAAFTINARGRWQCDLYTLARRRLTALGIERVYGGGWCTYADSARFFSYRRDGRCGRMAALIWRS